MVRYKTYVSIDGNDVTSRVLDWNFTEHYGNEIPDITLILSKKILDLYDISNGHEIIVKRGETTGSEYNIFSGRVQSITKDRGTLIVEASNYLIKLVNSTVNVSYDKNIDAEGGVGSEIAKDIITRSGLSYDSSSIISTGTTVLLDKFICRKTDVYERIKTLADIYQYQIWYDYDTDLVHFEPKGYSVNSNTLQVGVNVSNIPKWKENTNQLCNKIRVDGAHKMVQTTEIGQVGVTTGYTTAYAILNHVPESVKVYTDAANPPTTLKTGGVENSTATYDYETDKINKKILWNNAPTASHYVKVDYTYAVAVPVLLDDPASITSYGERYLQKDFSDIETVADAEKRGRLYLNTYSQPFVTVDLHVPSISNNYKVGQKVTIVDNYNNENRELIITKIVRKFPHKYDVLTCGDKEITMLDFYNDTANKIKRLQEIQNPDDGILIQIKDLPRNTRDSKTTKPFGYRKLNKKSITDTTKLIWNHPTQGKWNDGSSNLEKWGPTAFGSTSTVKVIQRNMTYWEEARDTDFHDSVNSTATFSTVTQDISFTSGQIWYSEGIDIGTTLSSLTVSLGTTTGTLKIEVSSDGKSTWQEVTNNTKASLTSSDGTGTYIRITETGSTTATIDLTTDNYGQVTHPLVKVVMEE